MKENDLETLTVKEVQEILKIGVNNAYALVRSKTFPVIKVGRGYRVPKDSFYAWLHHNTAAAELQCKPSTTN